MPISGRATLDLALSLGLKNLIIVSCLLGAITAAAALAYTADRLIRHFFRLTDLLRRGVAWMTVEPWDDLRIVPLDLPEELRRVQDADGNPVLIYGFSRRGILIEQGDRLEKVPYGSFCDPGMIFSKEGEPA